MVCVWPCAEASVEFAVVAVTRFQYKTDRIRVAAVAVDTAAVRAPKESNRLAIYLSVFELLRIEPFKLQAMSTSAD